MVVVVVMLLSDISQIMRVVIMVDERSGWEERSSGFNCRLARSQTFCPDAEVGIVRRRYSGKFYAACTLGGIASCGLTHMAVTPMDLVKCNMQTDKKK